jgi:hypothetical protein
MYENLAESEKRQKKSDISTLYLPPYSSVKKIVRSKIQSSIVFGGWGWGEGVGGGRDKQAILSY